MTEEQETTLIKRSIVLKRNDITWQEVLEHNTSEDCWIVIDNNVYDVTKFLDQHPGTPVPIETKAGKDVTQPFNDVQHSDHAKKLLPKYFMGTIKEGDIPLPEQVEPQSNLDLSKVLLKVIGVIFLVLAYIIIKKSF